MARVILFSTGQVVVSGIDQKWQVETTNGGGSYTGASVQDHSNPLYILRCS